MTRLLLFFTVLLLVGGAASGLCWQLPASVRAASIVSFDEQPAIKEAELNYLTELEAMKVGDAYPQRPAQFGSREEMLATMLPIGAYRGSLNRDLLPWQLARALFVLDLKLEGPQWPQIVPAFARAAAFGALLIALSAGTQIVCAVCFAGGGWALTRRRWKTVRVALVRAVVIVPPLMLLFAYRDYQRSDFYGPPVPPVNSLWLLTGALLVFFLLSGWQLRRRLCALHFVIHRRCTDCGYDMFKSEAKRCPECGRELNGRGRAFDPPRVQMIVTAAGYLMALGLVVLWPMAYVLLTHAPTPNYRSRKEFITHWLQLKIINAEVDGANKYLVGAIYYGKKGHRPHLSASGDIG